MIFGLNLITVDILDIMGQRILILQEVNLVGLLFRWNLVHVGFLLSLGLPLALIAVLMPVHQLIVTLYYAVFSYVFPIALDGFQITSDIFLLIV